MKGFGICQGNEVGVKSEKKTEPVNACCHRICAY